MKHLLLTTIAALLLAGINFPVNAATPTFEEWLKGGKKIPVDRGLHWWFAMV